MEKYDYAEEFKDTPEVGALEAEVATIDEEIVRLIQRRKEVASDIAQARLARGEPAYPHSEVLEQSARWSNAELGAAIIKICMPPPGRY